MSANVIELERQIRQMTPQERAELLERIDDLFVDEVNRTRSQNRDAALNAGIDPDDDEAVQRLVDKVRYGNAGGHVG